MSPEKRPGTYVAAAELDHGDRISFGANRDVATVVGTHVLPEDFGVLMVLTVSAKTMLRLEK